MGDYYQDQADANRAWQYGDPATRGESAQLVDAGRTSWETDQDKINAYLKQMAAANDPEYKLALSRGEAGIDTFLHDRGFGIVPTKAKYDVESGEVKDKSWWDKNKHWAIPAMMMGGAIAGPAAYGALAGSGGGAAGGAAAASGVLPATTTASTIGGLVAAPTGITAASIGGGAAAAAIPTAATTGGYSALANMAKTKGVDMLSRGLGAYANSKANERGDTLSALENHDRTQLYANQDQRAAEKDAMHQLAIAKYNGAGGYSPSTGGDPRYTSGISGPTASSPAQMQASKDMERILLERINNPFKPTDPLKYTKPGKGEKIAGYAGLALNGYSALKGLL